jgi:protein NRD1
MATDQGGKRGPQSTRITHDRFRRPERGADNYNSNGGAPSMGYDPPDASNGSTPAVPPAVPGFGFQFPGMPMFGAGFMAGAAQPGAAAPGQPPPPGHQG